MFIRPSARTRFSSVLVAAALTVGVSAVGLPAAFAVAPTVAPVPVAPAQDDVVTTDPVFSWQAVTGADRYRFQVSTSSLFGTTAYDVTTYGLHATPPTPLPAGGLFWRVAALDSSAASGPYSTTVQFTRSATAGPILTSPADGAALVYPTDPPVLTWAPLATAKSYTVDVDDNDTFTSPVTATTVNSQLALTEPPQLGTPQFWRVKATIGTAITTDYSFTGSFTVTWPAVPTLVAPAQAALVTDLRLQWSAVSGAKTYEVQISPNGDFQNNLVALGTEATVVTGTQYAPKATLQPQSYFWRVRPKDDAATVHPGSWSATGAFTLDTAPAPTTLAPGLDVTSGGTVPTVREPAMSWRGSPRAGYYEVQIGTDPNFSPGTFDSCTTFHTTYTPFWDTAPAPTVPAGGSACDQHFGASRYFWKVRGVEQLATGSTTYNGKFSPTMSFFFDGDVPVLTAPNEGASTEAPELSWDPVPGYNKYRVTIQKTDAVTLYTKDTYATSYTPIGTAAASAPTAPGNYAWTVQTLDSEGTLGPMGGFAHYTVVAPTGGTLATISPVGGTSVDMPSMSWTPAVGGQYSKVWYRAVGGSTWISLSGASVKVFLPAFTLTGEPLPAGPYEWFVEAFNSSGVPLGNTSSAPGTFTIADQEPATYLGPDNCLLTACVALRDTPQLSWNQVPYNHFYRVHIATDPDFANELRVYRTQNTTITFRESLPDNQAGQSYYWFVQPCKSPTVCGAFQDGALASREQSFRKQTLGVSLLAPADGATVGDDPHLSWTDYYATNSVTTDGSGAKGYHVQVATDAAFTNLVDDVTVDATSYTPFTKEYGDGTYYWHVQALDGAGQALTYGETRTFQKSSLQPVLDAVPVTTNPLPTLTWDPLAFVGGYKVEIYPGTTTNVATVVSQTTKLPAFTPSAALTKGTYTWRVAKLDPSGNRGPWSDTSTFDVALPLPVLAFPADGALLSGNDIVFNWSAPAGAAVASYRFDSSASAAFSTLFETQILSGTSWASPKRYPENTPNYWRVSALDGSSNVLSTSAVRSFTKDAVAPVVSTVTPTLDVPLAGPLTVTFSEAVNGVDATTLVVHPKGSSALTAGALVVNANRLSAVFTPTALLVPGQTYVVEVRAGITDDVGNAMAASLTERRAARIVDSTSAAVTELWDTDTASAANAGAYASSRIGGATISFTFSGTSTSVTATKTPQGGNGDVYLDGVKQATVSFYRSATAYKQTVWSKGGLASGTHTVMVRVLGTHPAGSTSNYVYLDAFTNTGVFVQENGVGVRQTFNRVGLAAAAGGSYDRELVDPAGDNGGKPEFKLTFVGTGVDYYAVKTAYSGQVKIYIDNVLKVTTELYSASTVGKFKAYASPTLPLGTHTIRVILAGTKTSAAKGYEAQLDQLVVR